MPVVGAFLVIAWLSTATSGKRDNFFYNALGFVNIILEFFSKCTRMAIMPILPSESLLRENKKVQ